MRRTRASLYVLLCVVLLAVLVPAPGSVALAAVRSVTVSLQDLAPEPISGHVDGGGVSSYLVYLDNPDARFHIYLVEMELSTRSTEPLPVRVYDHDGGLEAWGTVGGSHPPAFVADLFAKRDMADALDWDYIVQVDNSSNTRGKDFIIPVPVGQWDLLHLVGVRDCFPRMGCRGVICC
jgi:hypothetical protein